MKKIIYLIATILLIVTLYFYNSLPQEVPIHWNVNGEIDGYGPRYFILITAMLPYLIMWGMDFFKRIDPKRKNYEIYTKTYNTIKYSLALIFIILQIVTLLAAKDYNVDTGLIVSSSVGLLFIIFGNYMARIKQNFFVGIKTPWTLSSETVWNKTHRVGGYTFIILGLMTILAGILKNEIMMIILVISIIIGITFTFVYSYLEYKKEKN